MGARKNWLTIPILNAASMGANITAPTVDLRWMDNIKLYMTFSGTPTGTFTLNTTPDAGTTLFSLNPGLSGSPIASGSADTIQIALNQLPDPNLQIVYTRTSGTGSLTAWITAKML